MSILKKLLFGWVIVTGYLVRAKQRFKFTTQQIMKFVSFGDIDLAYDLIEALKRRPYRVGRRSRIPDRKRVKAKVAHFGRDHENV